MDPLSKRRYPSSVRPHFNLEQLKNIPIPDMMVHWQDVIIEERDLYPYDPQYVAHYHGFLEMCIFCGMQHRAMVGQGIVGGELLTPAYIDFLKKRAKEPGFTVKCQVPYHKNM